MCVAAAALRVVARHALRAGAREDAVVHARLFGPHSLLGWDYGITETYPNSLLISDARSSLTLPLSAIGGRPQDLFAAVRLMLTDIFNAYGVAEVPHITREGELRVNYFPDGYMVRELARQNEITISEEQID